MLDYVLCLMSNRCAITCMPLCGWLSFTIKSKLQGRRKYFWSGLAVIGSQEKRSGQNQTSRTGSYAYELHSYQDSQNMGVSECCVRGGNLQVVVHVVRALCFLSSQKKTVKILGLEAFLWNFVPSKIFPLYGTVLSFGGVVHMEFNLQWVSVIVMSV